MQGQGKDPTHGVRMTAIWMFKLILITQQRSVPLLSIPVLLELWCKVLYFPLWPFLFDLHVQLSIHVEPCVTLPEFQHTKALLCTITPGIIFCRRSRDVVLGLHDFDDFQNGGQPEVYDIEQIVEVCILITVSKVIFPQLCFHDFRLIQN